jgi:hypothetical protein
MKRYLKNVNDIIGVWRDSETYSYSELQKKYGVSKSFIGRLRRDVKIYCNSGAFNRERNYKPFLKAFKEIKESMGSKTTDTLMPTQFIKATKLMFNHQIVSTGTGGRLVEIPIDSQDNVNQRIQQHVQALIQDITKIVVTEYKEKLQKLTEMEAEVIRLTDENNKMTELLQTEGKKVNYFDYIKSKLQ